jgi:RNA-directed DNA polymerase
MDREFPSIPFERYADDVICHCSNERQAKDLQKRVKARFEACALTLHPEKTKIVYCKDDNWRQAHPIVQFDFLGYTFRPRKSKSKNGAYFVGFGPGISNASAKAIRQTMRGWKLHLRSDLELEDLACQVNPVLRGWINYYGAFYKSRLNIVLNHLDVILSRWAVRKYKALKHHHRHALRWLRGIARRQPLLFAHWAALRGERWIIGAA